MQKIPCTLQKSACILLVLLISAVCAEGEEVRGEADEVGITQLLSFDFMLLAMQLSGGGIGFGVQYERQFFPHYAMKGYFGHATINTKYEGWYCTTVSFGAFAEWYPLSVELRRLYVAAGSYFDYLGYINTDDDSEERNGNVLSLVAQLGYKVTLPQHFLLDAFVGYKFPYNTEVVAYGNANAYLRRGVQYGASLKRVLRQ